MITPEIIKRNCTESGQLRDARTKFIPELAKSEDERIRKEILGFVIDMDCKESWIHYLEKQKEQKWSPSKGEMGVLYKLCYISNKITDEDDTELTRLYQDLKREYFNGHSFENMFSNEKKKEQKEIPLMNGDADMYFDNWIQHNDTTKRGCFEEGIRYAQRLRKEQKPAEQNSESGDSEKPNNHAGWSEKDEKLKEELFELISVGIEGEDHRQDYYNFLDTHLNLQQSWKPSKKQMDALERCVDYLDDIDNEDAAVIGSLCHDLKLL